jgi:hypothetical protein
MYRVTFTDIVWPLRNLDAAASHRSDVDSRDLLSLFTSSGLLQNGSLFELAGWKLRASKPDYLLISAGSGSGCGCQDL